MTNKLILYVVFILFTATNVSAQNTLNKLILEDAQTAYENGQYSLCLEKIDELEKKGSKGLVLAHLKIMATSKLPESQLSYGRVVQLKKDVEYYLKNYDNEDFLPQYKDVYEVSKTLSAPKYEEAKLCVKEGDIYYQAKLYEYALEWYLKAGNYAEYINPNLFNRVGSLYFNGQGTEKDYQKAFEWYEKAAIQRDAIGQANLGNLYHNGFGVEQDFTKALEWYTKAANQGDAYSQFRLGIMYAGGQGVEKDMDKAIEWYTKAAQLGNQHAQDALTRLGKTW